MPETIIIKEEPVATSVIGPSKPARAAAPVELTEGESYDIVAALARAKSKLRLRSAEIIKTDAIKAEGGVVHCVSLV